ncbi:MAG: hypothetical protein ACD_38C00041G0003 [uncultured bacterium]|nr:MAG: hypothetical protein ACD_38C00041G0003 [uncultured bacterium]
MVEGAINVIPSSTADTKIVFSTAEKVKVGISVGITVLVTVGIAVGATDGVMLVTSCVFVT